MKALILGLVLSALLVNCAWAGNVSGGTIGRTLTADNETDCPVLNEIGVAKVWHKGAKAQVRTQLSYVSNIRNLADDNYIKISNILEF